MLIPRTVLALAVACLAACGPAVAAQGSVIADGTARPVSTPISTAAAVSAVTTRTAAPTIAPAAAAPSAAAFDASRYIGQGDAYNCGDFISQAQAQAVLRADPRDPNRLDTDKDGIACESNKNPRDLNPVPRS